MKKKYIIIQIITIIGILSIVSLFKILSYRLEIRKNEKILLNYYNLESTYGMTENSVNEIETCKNNSPQEYNITKLVDYYLEQLKSANDNKEIELIKESFYVNNNYYRQYGKNFTKYISDYKVDIDLLVEELKTILYYKGDNWFIPINASDRIELPYGYYLEYSVKGMFEKLNKVKRIQNVHLIDMFIISNKSENSKSKTYNISIDYIDNNDTKQNVIGMATYNYDNKLWNTSLYNLYYKLKKAEIRLCHHAYDKEREEVKKRIEKEMEEMQRQKLEYEENLSIEERYFNPVF